MEVENMRTAVLIFQMFFDLFVIIYILKQRKGR
nr:MAG TPA: hypothetical protein [Caudoviricetes sp.]